MNIKFFELFIVLTFLLSCKQKNDKIQLDTLPQEMVDFYQIPDTVKKMFYAYIGPEEIINDNDTIRISPNSNFDFIFIDVCKVKTELKSVPWIINSWFDHYELMINGNSLMTTKNLRPPFIIFNQKLFTSDLINVVDSTDYRESLISLIDLTGKLNVCD